MYIIIIGCGKIGSYLANLLQDEHNVVVVDREEKSFSKLGDSFNGIYLSGDGLDPDVLKEAGIEKADALVVTTSNDNINIVVAQIAKKIFNVPKVVARVSDVGKSEIYRNLGVDPVNSTAIFASFLKEKILGKNFTSYLFESEKLNILEIKNTGRYTGKSVEDVNIPGDFKIIAIIRGDEPVIPDEKTVIEDDDFILGVVRVSALRRIRRALKLQ
ncbi:MAG TPA: TrkA family potassium uptake protein [bacterium]|nr:TrkA family potassium uptake protein [bacterium]HPP30635.1 TrkA family potassium uptake protein [bacterium]